MTLAVVPSDPVRNAATEHRGFVRARLRRLGVETPDLDDATQDVFEVLARRIETYDPAQGSPRAYLSGIARRVAAGYRRRTEDVPYEDVAHDSRPDPERAVARAQAWAVLERFLERLDQDRWTVFVLSELEELRGPEVAAELSINVNTVYARLRSARRELAREVKRERARQRGPLGWLLGFAAVPRRGVIVTAGLGVAIILGLAVFGQLRACAGPLQEDVQNPREPTAAAEFRSFSRPTPARLAHPGDPERVEDSALPTREEATVGPQRWTNLATSTRTTPDFELVRSGRYRTEGDRLVLELETQADAAVEAFPFHLELDGFEVVEGTAAWSVSLQPETPHTDRVVLQAKHPGTARASVLTGFRDLETEHDAITGAVKLAFEFDGSDLELCARGGCLPLATLEDADPSGETILAHIRNACSEPVQLVLFAGRKDHIPPAGAPRHSLAPGEHLALRTDSNTVVYEMDGRQPGLVAGLSATHDVVFTGESCNVVSTRSRKP